MEDMFANGTTAVGSTRPPLRFMKDGSGSFNDRAAVSTARAATPVAANGSRPSVRRCRASRAFVGVLPGLWNALEASCWGVLVRLACALAGRADSEPPEAAADFRVSTPSPDATRVNDAFLTGGGTTVFGGTVCAWFPLLKLPLPLPFRLAALPLPLP